MGRSLIICDTADGKGRTPIPPANHLHKTMLFNKNHRKARETRRHHHECRKRTSKLVVNSVRRESECQNKDAQRRGKSDNHKGLLVISCSQFSISVSRTGRGRENSRLRSMVPSYRRNDPTVLRSAKLKKTCISGASSIRRASKRKGIHILRRRGQSEGRE